MDSEPRNPSSSSGKRMAGTSGRAGPPAHLHPIGPGPGWALESQRTLPRKLLTPYSPQICVTLTYQGAECLPSYKYPGKCGTDLGMRSEGRGGLESTQGQGSGDSQGDKQDSKGDCGSWATQAGQVAYWVPWLT